MSEFIETTLDPALRELIASTPAFNNNLNGNSGNGIGNPFLSPSNITDSIQDQISKLYIVFFDRAPENEGFKHWSDVLASGYGIENIYRDFSFSPEWMMQFGSMTSTEKVEHFYQNAFDRSADESGKNYWAGLMDFGIPFYEVARLIVQTGFNGGNGVGVEDTSTIRSKVEAAKFFALNAGSNDTALAKAAIELHTSRVDQDSAISGGLNESAGASNEVINSPPSDPGQGPVKNVSLAYSSGSFVESSANDGSIAAPLTILLSGDTFSANVTEHIVTQNVPPGLTANFVRTSDTVMTATLIGKATPNLNANDINNLTIRFLDGAFTSSTSAETVTGAVKADLVIDFADQGASGSGGSGGTGGTGGSDGTNNGDLYGDQYVLLRDLDPAGGGGNGEPVLDANGQFILVGTDNNPIYFVQNDDGDYEIPADKLLLVQTVELERANVARAPTSVLDKSLAAALEKINSAEVVDTDPAGRIVCDGATIDSPLENLALYKFLMTSNGQSSWTSVVDSWPAKIHALLGGDPLNPDWSPASLIGAAVSKESPISMDGVVYESTTLGVNEVTQIDGVQHIDYFNFINGTQESFNYDRASHFEDVWLQWYEDTDGDLNNLELVKSTLMEAVFDNENWSDEYIIVGTDPATFVTVGADSSGLNDFAQAAEDARAIINFMHESYGAVQIEPPPESGPLATISQSGTAVLSSDTASVPEGLIGAPNVVTESDVLAVDTTVGIDGEDPLVAAVLVDENGDETVIARNSSPAVVETEQASYGCENTAYCPALVISTEESCVVPT